MCKRLIISTWNKGLVGRYLYIYREEGWMEWSDIWRKEGGALGKWERVSGTWEVIESESGKW